MNILHIATFLQGGAGRIITTIMIEEKKRGNDVFLICTDTEEAGYCSYPEYLELLRENDIKVIKVDSTFKRDIYLNFIAVQLAKKIIIKYQIDIIHTYAAVPSLIGLIARSGIKKIPIIQNMFGWGTNKTKEQENMDITIMSSIERIVTDSNSSKELLIHKGIDHNKIKIIYDSIIEEDSIIKDKDVDLVEIKQLKENNNIIIGCVGTVSKNKNQELLIDGFRKFHNIYIDSVCVFVGDGDQISQLNKKCKNYGIDKNIRFYGYKKSAIQFIKNFDVLVLPSLSEGAPVSIVEAFKENVLVVGSNIPSIAELITEGETGYLFNNNDSNDLCNVLERIMLLKKEKKLKIVEKAYFQNKFRFDTNRMIDEYLQLYFMEIENINKR